MAFDQEYVQGKLTDSSPKCGNCQHFNRYDGRSGDCQPNSTLPIRALAVTDMQLCSAWTRKEAKDDE